jgi:hypothetical protein
MMLTERGYPDGVEVINTSIGTVTFDDYTLWRHGKFLRPDPHNPNTWRVIKPAGKESSAPRTKQSEPSSTIAGTRFIPISNSKSSGRICAFPALEDT